MDLGIKISMCNLPKQSIPNQIPSNRPWQTLVSADYCHRGKMTAIQHTARCIQILLISIEPVHAKTCTDLQLKLLHLLLFMLLDGGVSNP